MDDLRPTRGLKTARRPHVPWKRAGSCSARARFVASGLVCGLSALACQTGTPPAFPSAPPAIVIGVPNSRQLDLSPGIQFLANSVANERLTGSDAGGRTAPRLVERWTESDDGLTWRLVLRAQARYHDGTPLVAADVKRQLDEERSGSASEMIAVCVPDIRDTSVVNDRELVVRLNRRCAFLLDDLDMAITRSVGEDRPEIGTGPFAIASRSKDQVVLEANADYYLGAPAIGKVVIKEYDTLRTAWAEMMRGRVDFLWDVGPDTVEFLRDQSSVRVHSYLSYYAYTIVLNSARPIFHDAAVRRALNLAVDRVELVQQALKNQGVAGDDTIWPSFWARDGSVSGWAYDPKGAIRLLAAAGRGGLPPATGAGVAGPRLVFTCLVPTNSTIYERLALLVQRQLRLVNVEMRLEALPTDVYNRRIGAGNFDAILTNLVGGPSRTIHYRFWHSPERLKRLNYWGYRDEAVDRALEQMRDAPDDSGTRAAIKALRLALRDSPPAIVLAWSKTIQAVSSRFELPDSAAGRDALHGLSRWALRKPGGSRP